MTSLFTDGIRLSFVLCHSSVDAPEISPVSIAIPTPMVVLFMEVLTGQYPDGLET